MNKPYIVCHMMTSVDGRIDCAMTSKLRGVNEYYSTLSALNTPTTFSGRVTAQLELALPGNFIPTNYEPVGAAGFSKKTQAEGYSVVADSKGSLLWDNDLVDGLPLIVVVSEQASREYLEYLDCKNISWIVAGTQRIDLVKASEILKEQFNVQRMAIVGGGNINAGFLDAGLLDEISILLAPGIDARGGMAAVFDGLAMDKEPVQLKLENITSYDDGAIWIRYSL